MTFSNNEDLNELVHKAIAAFNALSPEEERAHRREQAISWAYEQLTCTGRRNYITREMIEKEYDDNYGKVQVHFGPVHLQAYTNRAEVCEEQALGGDMAAAGESLDLALGWLSTALHDPSARNWQAFDWALVDDSPHMDVV